MKMTLLWSIPIVALVLFCFWFLMPEAEAQDVHYVSPVPDHQLDITRLVSAIAAVEHSPSHFISLSGARSKYQIKESVWLQHSSQPHSAASFESKSGMAEAERVAKKHVKWIIAELNRKGYTATPRMVGQVWIAGLTKWLEHRQSFHDVQFGERVANVYGETSK